MQAVHSQQRGSFFSLLIGRWQIILHLQSGNREIDRRKKRERKEKKKKKKRKKEEEKRKKKPDLGGPLTRECPITK
ncbi:hypothetical protein TRV_06259 [Trichophyton verrucosum HKI 0517]|uniref:Uncharacterized protein n=1 Tax=Trichophyton verrucosum (strain HKI 0517) TaxID=663202 RepID=D4DGF6_TRIVH|nr:uncharacterized protein TRV_06259 [Trichophyton verrucosum HKI 0517]EFE39072.1 hypothetical protein TRV_06259 [Trichophyton verrucosum HKI 0517]